MSETITAEELTAEHIGRLVFFFVEGELIGGVLSKFDTEHYDSRVLVELGGTLDQLYNLGTTAEVVVTEPFRPVEKKES